MARRTGAFARWPTRPASPRPACIATSSCSACSRTAARTSSCRPTRSSSRSCATSSGLYLSPPDNALVLCVDEKSQCQALERTQPMLPLGLGYVEGVTHDYVRHGTTTLFAALNVLNGAVLAECKPRHRHQEFLSFLRAIDNRCRPSSTSTASSTTTPRTRIPKVRGLAGRAGRAGTCTSFPPTAPGSIRSSASSALITDKAIRRGSFSVGQGPGQQDRPLRRLVQHELQALRLDRHR